MATQRAQNAIDMEFLKRQSSPFEAPQRSPFFEEVTDAFGRRLPFQLKDPLALDSAIISEHTPATPTTRSPRGPFRANGSPIATTTPSSQAATTTSTLSTPTAIRTATKVIALNEDSKIEQVESKE